MRATQILASGLFNLPSFQLTLFLHPKWRDSILMFRWKEAVSKMHLPENDGWSGHFRTFKNLETRIQRNNDLVRVFFPVCKLWHGIPMSTPGAKLLNTKPTIAVIRKMDAK
jgi:hypothetical protein